MNQRLVQSRVFRLFFGGMLLLLLSGCGGGSPESVSQAPPATPTPSGDPAAGSTVYLSSCSSCHGPDAKGIPGVGKDLTTGDFLPGLTDEEFVAFVNTGRPSGDPANTTGIDMPPKGGNPALSDDQIYDIIAYLRSIHD